MKVQIEVVIAIIILVLTACLIGQKIKQTDYKVMTDIDGNNYVILEQDQFTVTIKPVAKKISIEEFNKKFPQHKINPVK